MFQTVPVEVLNGGYLFNVFVIVDGFRDWVIGGHCDEINMITCCISKGHVT